MKPICTFPYTPAFIISLSMEVHLCGYIFISWWSQLDLKSPSLVFTIFLLFSAHRFLPFLLFQLGLKFHSLSLCLEISPNLLKIESVLLRWKKSSHPLPGNLLKNLMGFIKVTCFSFFRSSSKSFFISLTMSCLSWAWKHESFWNLNFWKWWHTGSNLFHLGLHHLCTHLGRGDRRRSFHHHCVPDKTDLLSKLFPHIWWLSYFHHCFINMFLIRKREYE